MNQKDLTHPRGAPWAWPCLPPLWLQAFSGHLHPPRGPGADPAPAGMPSLRPRITTCEQAIG